MYRFADLVEEHAAELAVLDVLEMGKPVADAVAYDIPQVAQSLRFFGEVADKVGGRTTLSDEDVVGTIWVNTFNDGDFGQPFGGYKQSGHARDNSIETLLAHTQTKSAWFRI